MKSTERKRKIQAPGEPQGDGNNGSFALEPKREAEGFELRAQGPVTIALGTAVTLNTSSPLVNEWPANLPPAKVSYGVGDNGRIYVYLGIDDGDDTVEVMVWQEYDENCSSIYEGAEETPWDDQTNAELLAWAHEVRGNIEPNAYALWQAAATTETQDAIIALATGETVPVTPLVPVVDFDEPDISDLTDEQVFKLQTAIIARTGLTSPIIDIEEAAYRAYEEPQGIPTPANITLSAEVAKAEEKLGGRRQLLEAIVETQPWNDLHEVMTEALTDPIMGTAAMVRAAIAEINAAP